MGPLSPPTWRHELLPPKESKQSAHVASMLAEMSDHVTNFAGALFLFESNSELVVQNAAWSVLIRTWVFIAARDGAMTIYHLGRMLDTLRSELGNVAILRSHIDTKALRQASKDFRAAFPFYVKLRHSIAHAGDMQSLRQREKNTARGGIPGIIDGEDISHYSSNDIINRQFTQTFEGQYVQYEVSEQTLITIGRIVGDALNAFRDVDAKLGVTAQKT